MKIHEMLKNPRPIRRSPELQAAIEKGRRELRNAMRLLDAQHEAELERFALAGAMRGDIMYEIGPVQFVAEDPQQPHLLTVKQHFRVI